MPSAYRTASYRSMVTAGLAHEMSSHFIALPVMSAIEAAINRRSLLMGRPMKLLIVPQGARARPRRHPAVRRAAFHENEIPRRFTLLVKTMSIMANPIFSLDDGEATSVKFDVCGMHFVKAGFPMAFVSWAICAIY